MSKSDLSLSLDHFPPDLTTSVSFCCYLYPPVSPFVNEPRPKVKNYQDAALKSLGGLHRVTVMSWRPTIKLHDEDSRFSCYRYRSRQSTNHACLSQNGAPIPRLPALELGVMFPWSSGGNCATLLHSVWPTEGGGPFCCPKENAPPPSLSPCLSCLCLSSRDSWLLHLIADD